MNRFHLCLLLSFLLLSISPRIQALRASFTSLSTGKQQQQVFDTSITAPDAFGQTTRDMESEKRKVPTGSNPLHNRR
uniref:Uncharacterized protein n=1 Tax=Nelumbo nucifera TaxID=4432 RepID=A0A822XMF5_NELNU|nr:TPA_asm: hypothetical protein HUJ06_021854 [Nelumbo nucifera]